MVRVFDVALSVRIVWIEVVNLVLLCLLLGSVIGAAPKAQPKATWNAQKVIAQLRVLLGTFYIHVHYLCALPVPLSEKVSPALKRLETSLKIQKIRFSGCGHCFGTVLGTLWAPFWHNFGTLFGVVFDPLAPLGVSVGSCGVPLGLSRAPLRHFWCPLGFMGAMFANFIFFNYCYNCGAILE